jgi:hypothetical protein
LFAGIGLNMRIGQLDLFYGDVYWEYPFGSGKYVISGGNKPYISPSIGFRYYLKKENTKLYLQPEAVYNIGQGSGAENRLFEGKFGIGFEQNNFSLALIYSKSLIVFSYNFQNGERNYIDMISLRLGYRFINVKK